MNQELLSMDSLTVVILAIYILILIIWIQKEKFIHSVIDEKNYAGKFLINKVNAFEIKKYFYKSLLKTWSKKEINIKKIAPHQKPYVKKYKNKVIEIIEKNIEILKKQEENFKEELEKKNYLNILGTLKALATITIILLVSFLAAIVAKTFLKFTLIPDYYESVKVNSSWGEGMFTGSVEPNIMEKGFFIIVFIVLTIGLFKWIKKMLGNEDSLINKKEFAGMLTFISLAVLFWYGLSLFNLSDEMKNVYKILTVLLLPGKSFILNIFYYKWCKGSRYCFFVIVLLLIWFTIKF